MIARLMARVGLVTPEQRAWAWDDWANSVYFTTVITAVFPSFYATYAAKGLEPAQATARFGLITTISVLVVAVLSPILGALADYSGVKKQLLAIFMSIGVTACALMVFIGEGDIMLASVLFFIGNIGVSGSTVFYDSLLPHVARADETDRVSSAGYAMGYLSGGLLLLLNLAWILYPATFGFGSSVSAIRASFVSVAIWWAVFSIPLFRKVPEPRRGIGARRFRDRRRIHAPWPHLQGSAPLSQRVPAVHRDAALPGRHSDRDPDVERLRRRGRHRSESQIAAFVMVQFVGIPFAILFGALGARIGTKTCLFIAIAVYVVAASLAYFMTSVTHFFLLAFLIATVLGGSQALSRALFARMIPQDRTSEFFGFYAVSERFATVFGPVLFTISVAVTGSSRTAILAIIGLFVAGAFVLSLVNEDEGTRAAASA